MFVDLGIKDLTHVNIYCDNESTIKLVQNPILHEKIKHLEVDLHFIRENVLNGVFKIVKISSSNQNADILTK